MTNDVINELNNRVNPPIGGYAISNQGNGSKGTFGLLVGVSDTNNSYICFLTAYHVVKNDANICAISQPGIVRSDIITLYNSNYPVCNNENGKYLIFFDEKLDVAACIVDLNARDWRHISTIYSKSGPKRLASVVSPTVGSTAYKVGQKTGITSGAVTGAQDGKYIVQGAFCDSGDSGAPVYDPLGNWLGIVTSGKSTSYGVFTGAASISNSMRNKGLRLQLLTDAA